MTAPIEASAVAAELVSVYEATSGWRALDVREMWRFRGLLRALVIRDVKLRYRQTLLGVAWVVLLPLLSAGVLALVFGGVAKLPSEAVPYFLISLSGTAGWSFFSGVLTRGSSSLVSNASLVSKVFFPRALLPFSAVGSALVDASVALALTVVAAATQGIYPGPRLLLAPVWLVLGLLVVLGPALILSAAMVTYRDVAYVLPVVVQFLLFLSPVAYDANAVPQRYRTLYGLNPFTAPIEGLRHALVGVGSVTVESVLSSVVAAGLLLALGALYFRRREQLFADVI